MKKMKYFLYLFGIFLSCELLLVFVLYQFTTGKMSDAMESSARRQLVYTAERLNDKSKEVEMLASSLISDATIRFFYENLEKEDFDNYQYVETVRKIKEKLSLALINANDVGDIVLYWPSKDLLISANSIDKQFKLSFYRDHFHTGKNWFFKDDVYCYSLSYPFLGSNSAYPELFVFIETRRNFLNDIRLTASNIESARSLIKLADQQMILPNASIDMDRHIAERANLRENKETVYLDHKKMTVLSETTKESKISIITYFDNNAYMSPMIFISVITFAGVMVLLIIGLMLMMLFYKNIFSQMNVLLAHFRKVENGHLETKIETKATNEFNYVFNQFNQMTTGINRFILSLNNEYKKRDLAERKYLQAQINPHFLYNSLFYIISVAENPEAVRKMTRLLAEYYQYRTKSKSFVTVEEEIQFSETFLGIMSLRKSIHYQIQFEEDGEVLDELILPLLIQPLLENAVEHGIAESDVAYQLILKIEQIESNIYISVDDDGRGLTDVEITELMRKINLRENNEPHVGLWNVNQRLINYYGRQAVLHIKRSEKLGGLAVSFTIQGEKSHEIIDS